MGSNVDHYRKAEQLLLRYEEITAELVELYDTDRLTVTQENRIAELHDERSPLLGLAQIHATLATASSGTSTRSNVLNVTSPVGGTDKYRWGHE